MLRDLFFMPAAFAIVLIAAVRPQIGVLGWAWFSFMNPYREAWGAISYWPWVKIMAAATFLGLLFSKENKIPHFDRTLWLITIFFAWTTLTTMASLYPSISWVIWDRLAKNLVIVFLIAAFMNSKVRVTALTWVIVLSLAYWGYRAFAHLIFTGALSSFNGPADSMIEDRNHLAVALCMVLPLLNYLRGQVQNNLIRLVCMGSMFVVTLGVIGTNSRGGFVALAAVLAYLVIRSKKRIAALLVVPVFALAAFSFAPDHWRERMSIFTSPDTIEEDRSFTQRTQAWTVSWRVAQDYPLGVGFYGPQQARVYFTYYPEAEATSWGGGRAAHSIYFQVLGEHGFVGLFLYLALIGAAWANTQHAIKLSRDRDDLQWIHNLSKMIQVSFVAFLAGGAALSLAYYEVFFTLIVITGLLRRFAREAAEPAQAKASARAPQLRPAGAFTGARRVK